MKLIRVTDSILLACDEKALKVVGWELVGNTDKTTTNDIYYDDDKIFKDMMSLCIIEGE